MAGQIPSGPPGGPGSTAACWTAVDSRDDATPGLLRDEHPNDIASTPPDETADTNDYPQRVLSSPAVRWVSGLAYHCYYGDPSAMTALHDQFPGEDIYQTECSGSQSAVPADTFSDTLKWHARNLEIGPTRNWAKSVVNWNLALDPSGGPHGGGCGTCTGIVTVGPDGTVTPDAEYYALGQLSRFVQPGAVRIASTPSAPPAGTARSWTWPS